LSLPCGQQCSPLGIGQPRSDSPVPSWALTDTKICQSPSGVLAADNTHCEAQSLFDASVSLYRTFNMRMVVRRGQSGPAAAPTCCVAGTCS